MPLCVLQLWSPNLKLCQCLSQKKTSVRQRNTNFDHTNVNKVQYTCVKESGCFIKEDDNSHAFTQFAITSTNISLDVSLRFFGLYGNSPLLRNRIPEFGCQILICQQICRIFVQLHGTKRS